MSSLRNIFFATVSVVLALPTLANAADIIDYIPEPDPIPSGGWYLRGDIGFKMYADPNAHTSYNSIGDFYGENLDNTWMVGAGVGYYWNDWFRSDVTVDYEGKAGFTGRAPCGLCGVGYSIETADIDVWTVMFNAYADLGTWHGITPYVGAGVGAAYVRTSDVAFDNGGGTTGTYGGAGSWNFAWALMAGAAYEVTPNMMIDAGYQFRSLGEAQSGKVAGTQSRIKYEDLYAHELRLGLRYNFN